MKLEAKKILREELKTKGLSSIQIDELFAEWNEKVDEAKEENKEDDLDVRHGTTCIGIISPKHKKTITEF